MAVSFSNDKDVQAAGLGLWVQHILVTVLADCHVHLLTGAPAAGTGARGRRPAGSGSTLI